MNATSLRARRQQYMLSRGLLVRGQYLHAGRVELVCEVMSRAKSGESEDPGECACGVDDDDGGGLVRVDVILSC